MKRRKPLSRRSRLRRASKTRAAQLREYAGLRKAWIKDHLFCEICHKNMTAQVHHKSGRVNTRLLDTEYWCAICTACHSRIHTDPKWAKENGYLL